MDDARLSTALERAERALARIERAADGQRGRNDLLRSRVREAVAELDQLIRMAEA
jgi:multidrug resistance efflux pump